MSGPPELLVNPHSATHGRLIDTEKNYNYDVDSTHSGLAKFSSREDRPYKIVVEHLKRMKDFRSHGWTGLKRGGWNQST